MHTLENRRAGEPNRSQSVIYPVEHPPRIVTPNKLSRHIHGRPVCTGSIYCKYRSGRAPPRIVTPHKLSAKLSCTTSPKKSVHLHELSRHTNCHARLRNAGARRLEHRVCPPLRRNEVLWFAGAQKTTYLRLKHVVLRALFERTAGGVHKRTQIKAEDVGLNHKRSYVGGLSFKGCVVMCLGAKFLRFARGPKQKAYLRLKKRHFEAPF